MERDLPSALRPAGRCCNAGHQHSSRRPAGGTVVGLPYDVPWFGRIPQGTDNVPPQDCARGDLHAKDLKSCEGDDWRRTGSCHDRGSNGVAGLTLVGYLADGLGSAGGRAEHALAPPLGEVLAEGPRNHHGRGTGRSFAATVWATRAGVRNTNPSSA